MAPLYCLLFFLIYFSREHCYAIDSITNTKFLQDPQFIVSGNGTFKLGFFSPQNSANRYVGIWFNKVPTQTVVWVANRDTPIKDSSGVLKISDDGNLQLINGQKVIIWSTNVTSTAIKNSTAQLQESGNLVLQQSNSTDTLWQSFDHPTDTFLPGMNPTIPGTSNMKNIIFKSWKSLSDPSEGSFSIGIGTPNGLPQVFTWKDGANYWRSGPFDGNNFIGLPNVDNTLKDGFVLNKNDGNGTYDMSFDPEDASWLFNYVVIPNGTIIEQYWNEANWTPGWVAPSSACEVYAKCGPFGSCDHDSATCKCLQGFQPKFDQEWRKGNTSSGCVRRKKLECGIQGGTEDVFLRLQTMKVPDNSVQVSAFSQDGCRTNCVTNCSCLAYAYHLNIGCMIWNQDLIDTQDFSAGGVDLYIRLAASELEKNSAHKRVAIIISVTIVSAIVAATIIYFLRRRKMNRGKREKSNRYKFEVGPVGQLELQEPPLYTYDLLRYATNNFDESNKLGEGGFGPVYKGSLENGQEIAVKRLSKSSGQGLEEFMTEVKVISKLQHRNLVRLLGCCIEGEEKMLVYEYMPNRSLDAFLFNSLHHEHLSWEKRFNIIEGICRGLLYLHRDSRLRIIHRDLKPSNILLDEDLNPKISDFGMARIFGGNQDQANTRRVVGTYGYMSPEYTMGHFSEKSDVYSFGVILLEIVSGRRNSTFHREEQSLTLVGNAWKLWNEGNMISFIDSVILEPSFQESILKCIQIGLLCVQELSKDRPNISTVITMLDTDTKDLPHPKRPPFTEWEISSEDQQSSSLLSSSTNTYSTTIIQGR